MAGAGYYVFSRAVEGGPYVTVPDISKKPLSEAYSVLSGAQLEMGTPRERVSTEMQEYFVISQTPLPGKVVRAGRKVYPTISVTPDKKGSPDLRGMSYEDALAAIAKEQFAAGTYAHVANPAPRETVLAQDPPPGAKLTHGASIHLLLSAGPPTQSFLMPLLEGKSLQDVRQLLASFGRNAVPILVSRSDAPFDVVTEQNPAPGTPLGEGDKVFYKVRTNMYLPNAWREVVLSYEVPTLLDDQEVSIQKVDQDGSTWRLFPRPEDYVNGQPPRFPGGTRISLPLAFADDITVVVYLNGRKARSYYYFRRDPEPLITDYTLTQEF